MTSTDTWVAFKLWVFLPATFLFAAANVPMLLKPRPRRREAGRSAGPCRRE